MAVIAFAALGAVLASGAAGGATAIGLFGLSAAMTGAMIGSAVGGIVDQTVLFPAIFGQKGQTITGPKLDDRQIQTGSEGSPINYILGTARCAGTVIWADDIQEVEDVLHTGGKGGGGGTRAEKFTYFNTFAIGFCEGLMSEVEKIWADGKLIYQQGGLHNLLRFSQQFQELDAWQRVNCDIAWNVGSRIAPDGTQTADRLLSKGIASARCGQHNIKVKANTTYTFSFYAWLGTLPHPNLAIYQNSTDTYLVMPTAYTPGSGAWTRITQTFTTGDPPLDGTDLTIDVYILHGGDATGTVYVWGAQLEEGSSASAYEMTEAVSFAADPQFSSINLYMGDETQTADPFIEAKEGVGETPAFRGLCYAVIEKLDLTNFGNRIPQMTAQIRQQKKLLVKQALQIYMDHVGFSMYNLDKVGKGKVEGVLLSGPQVPSKVIENLMICHDLMANETSGNIHFFNRKSKPFLRTAFFDYAAREEGATAPRAISYKEVGAVDLPSEMVLNYIDPDVDYQRGAQRERVRNFVNDQTLNLDLPFVFKADHARDIARRLLWDAWAEYRSCSVTLPPIYLEAQEGDLVELKDIVNGELFKARITKLLRGANHIFEVTLVCEQDRIPQPSSTTSTALEIAAAPSVYSPPALRFDILDIPAVRESEMGVTGVYYAISARNPADTWRGAALYASDTNDDSLFNQVASVRTQAFIGQVAVATPEASVDTWDNVNTIDVYMTHGALENKTETQVLNGDNWAKIGQEIIGFQTATLIATRTYRLSVLARGLRGTSTLHAPHERFILLNDSIGFLPMSMSLTGTTRYFRAVAVGDHVENSSGTKVAFTGATLKPLSPVNVAGSRDGSNNLTLTWDPRSRSLAGIFSTAGGRQFADELMEFEVDIITSGGVVLRTIEVTDTEATYAASDQSTDGLTPGDPVNVRVYQIGSAIGRGFAAEAAV
jgi:hypothetical protein